MTGSLEGLLVATVGNGLAADLAGMYLADHGAEVVKVEAPGGDPRRALPGWRVWNRGKRSVVADLTSPAGREQVRTLLTAADVAIDALPEGQLEAIGMPWNELHAANPALILCQITGYAGLSAHRGRPAAESLVAARTGQQWEQRGFVGGPVDHLLGRPGPEPDLEVAPGIEQGAERDGPLHLASPFGSVTASFLANLGIHAALFQRERTGMGQRVQTSLLQGFLALNMAGWQRPQNPDADGYWMWVLDRRGPKGLFECADGRWIHQWPMNPAAVLDAAAAGDLTAAGSSRNRDDARRLGMEAGDLVILQYYYPQLVEAFVKFGADEWVDLGQKIDVGAQPVRSPEEALLDDAFVEDGCVVSVDDPDHGRIRHVGVSYQLLDTPGAVTRPAPAVGVDTDEVVRRVRDRRAVVQPTASTRAPARAALEGIRVLDLGLGVAGPYATHLLADLGADVIKINTLWDRFWLSTHMGVGCNRGKRSIAINLKDERGRDVVRRLAETADVVAHNMRIGAAERLGLDYASVAAINPAVVYCHSRGFDKGPRVSLPGTDQTAGALAGTEWEDGGCARGGRPFWSPTSLGDTGNGFLAAMAIVHALHHRERTGKGQQVDTAIVNACLLVASSTWVAEDGTAPARAHLDADQQGFDALNRLYETADGWVCIAAGVEQHGAPASAPASALASALGIAEATTDDSFASAAARAARGSTSADLIARLEKAGVPAEVSSPTFAREFFADAEAWSRGLLVRHEHPVLGTIEQHGALIELSGTPGAISRPAPLCGQHTVEILSELGLDQSGIDGLLADRVVLDGRP
jgi:crotonobetainyl-CoA:carnitine CoA-transferase CaiB-like acyl-CoA transferase